MMSASRKTLRARIEAVLHSAKPADPGGAQGSTNANICEPGLESDFPAVPATTMPPDNSHGVVRRPPSHTAVGDSFSVNTNMDGIYRVHFAGFDRAAYQAMEDTLIRASQSVNDRFVPTDPVSMALGAQPDVLVINLNHPDATQLGKTLRPAPGVPVVWVSISPEQKGVGEPGSPLFINLVKAMQDVQAQRAALRNSPASSAD
ncbi:MAG: hypothetical protein SF172_16655 [Burkholderiales bacterium]|nr:hypothetical protein [Burkholderiales bacterium]